METTKKTKAWWVKLLIIFGCIVAFFGVVLLGGRIYFRAPVGNYYERSEKGFEIPELSNGFVPQGLDYHEETDYFLMTGYMNDGSASPIAVVEKNSGKHIKTVKLKTDDGKDYTGHAGGIGIWKDYIYIAGGNSNCLFVFSTSSLWSAKNGDSITSIGTFSLQSETDEIRSAFVSITSEGVITGEFYRPGNYETLETHHTTTLAGAKNKAVALLFPFDESGEFGLSKTPTCAYSLPDQVQGMEFNDGKIYASTSYGLAFSNIHVYTESALQKQADITLLDTVLPFYALDSASHLDTLKIPPMSEEVAIVDGKMYTMCESASNKYIFGKFTSSKWCYATDLSKYF